ncbi:MULTISPECIES: DUF805 domain-containing protein [unclassified Salinibacterium]|uniref:DUF805 domain-containing protein n=1 Tax=unclassified Salinibacterium TaxID=2632331 RepID=UPI001749C046|nr:MULTISPECIES: DUF805 domain-containing protein [unclassified Salinibacterium]
MSGTDAVIPPGWYPDAEVPGGQRWWDGMGWTDYRKSPAEVAASAPAYVAPVAPAAYMAPGVYAGGAYGVPVGPTPVIDPVTGQVPLWAPLYGATFAQAWTRFWRKYSDFTGRASRSEYWFASLGVIIVWFGAYFLFAILGGVGIAFLGGDSYAAPGVIITLLSLLFLAAYIAMIIPLIAVTIRRLHDAGYPGTYFLLGFIPFVGSILLIVFCVAESRPSGAIYDRPTS